jgi:hypothetical protein
MAEDSIKPLAKAMAHIEPAIDNLSWRLPRGDGGDSAKTLGRPTPIIVQSKYRLLGGTPRLVHRAVGLASVDLWPSSGLEPKTL